MNSALRISFIIGEAYNKYLPLAEKNHIQLNLDLGNDTSETDNAEQIAAALDEHLNSALQRSKPGEQNEITVGIKDHYITITDSGTILSQAICHMLSHGRVSVKSRVGFGTTVSIDIAKSQTKEDVQAKIEQDHSKDEKSLAK